MNLIQSNSFNVIRIGLASWKDDDYMVFREVWSLYTAFEHFKKMYGKTISDGDEIILILEV